MPLSLASVGRMHVARGRGISNWNGMRIRSGTAPVFCCASKAACSTGLANANRWNSEGRSGGGNLVEENQLSFGIVMNDEGGALLDILCSLWASSSEKIVGRVYIIRRTYSPTSTGKMCQHPLILFPWGCKRVAKKEQGISNGKRGRAERFHLGHVG
jgi:hypothetical protein